MESTLNIQDSRAVILFAVVTILACQKEPATYEDCILQSVKPSMSKEAAGMVAHACDLKFEPVPTPLNEYQVSLLTGRGERSYVESMMSVSLYNSLDDITITEVDINVTTTVRGERTTKTYRNEVTISPKSTKSLTFRIVPGDRVAIDSWSISGGKGIYAPR